MAPKYTSTSPVFDHDRVLATILPADKIQNLAARRDPYSYSTLISYEVKVRRYLRVAEDNTVPPQHHVQTTAQMIELDAEDVLRAAGKIGSPESEDIEIETSL